MAQITKQLALSIAKKLGANTMARAGKRHDLVQVEHQGRVIAMFGLRRGSNKDIPHDFVASQLYVSARQAKLLGQCPMTKEEWLKVMSDKGML